MDDGVSVGPAEYAMVSLGALAYACYTFSWFVLPATLSPMIAEVGLTTTQAGLLVGAIPAVYVPLGLVSGLLIDRLGSRYAIGIALVVFGAVQLARGIATDFWTLLLPTLLMGVAGTAITFGLPKLVSDLFPPSQTGSMSSVYQIGASAGPAAAFGLAMPVLAPILGGWRPIFLANGMIVLGYAVVWWVTSSGYVRRRSWGATGELREDSDSETAFTLASARRDLRQVIGSRNMRLLILVGLMYLFVNHGLRGWLAVILEARGYSPSISGLATSLLVVAGIAGTLTIPPFSDRIGRRRPMLVTCGVLCVVGSLGILVGGQLLITVGALVAVGAGLGGLSPLIKVVPIELDSVGPRLTATAVSFIYAVGELGGFGGPVVIGAIRDQTGSFGWGIAVLVGACLVIVVATAAMSEPSSP